MFGSEAMARHVFSTLRNRTAVSAVVGSRIYNDSIPPQGATYPLCIHYDESATYGQDVLATGQLPSEETLRYVVRFICEGVSDAPVRPALKDAMEALVVDNAHASVSLEDGSDYTLDIGAQAEWPRALGTEVVQAGSTVVRFRQRGFYLSVAVFRD